MKPPKRLQTVLNKIKAGKKIDALKLLDLSNLEFMYAYKALKRAEYTYTPGMFFYLPADKTCKK